jgi:hypothetical protein
VIEQDGTLAGSVAGTVTTYRVTGLAPDATHTYRVLAFQGAHPSPVSAALVTRTSPPPPWQAVLTGKRAVSYKVTGLTNFSFGPTRLSSDTWTFTPMCAASQCPITVKGALNGAPFTATLRLSGHVHVGSTKDGNYISCIDKANSTSTPMSATLALAITGLSEKVASGQWIASSWRGSMTISAPRQSGCDATSVTATINSSG